ncbi:MAG TPA: FAD-dependent oxidoreductase [Candidatus Saccharimonadales bacterium]|nr:FAD-dependent oxidoreductase [Candidatus Saccharimonadales bacterium]
MTSTTKDVRKKVIIVGGGFAGVSMARHLGHDARFDVQLFSNRDHFLYYPALYGTATGHSAIESAVPMDFVLYDVPRVALTKQEVTSFDPKKHTITTATGETHHYDTLVLALGVVTSYFGIPGLEEYSYGIKSMEEVARLRSHLHDELVKNGRLEKEYAVVGAGPTGVELAASLTSYLRRIARMHRIKPTKIKINLIEAAPRILPRMTETASDMIAKRLRKLGVTVMTGKTVQADTPTSLVVDGKALPTETTIWTAGVANHPFFQKNSEHFTFDKRHKVVVDDHMLATKDVYVLGDNAGTEYSGLAEVAVSDGVFLAKHFIRLADGKLPKPNKGPHPIPFIPIGKGPSVVIPVGEHWALVEYKQLVITGLLAWWIRRAADFLGYWDVMPFFMALTVWTADRSEVTDCATCRLKT